MRFLLLLSALLGIISVSTGWRTFMRGRSRYDNLKELSSDDELPKEQWFTQEFDHFSPFNNRVWKQRYFVNSDYYKPNGPIFLMIGAEGFIDPKWMVEGQWIEYAKEFGAMCFYLEHRYYGKSHPTPDLSVKNLGLLSSELALADVANFIEQINVGYKFPKGTKWIAFGGSYGGSLAAWMRVKYAHLVHGAVSSSGPLLLEIDFQEYYVVVENALKEYSQQCVDAVQEGNRQFHILLHHVAGQQKIANIFKLCDPIDPGYTKKVDIANLYETLASNFANIVQYNKDNRRSSRTANITIETVCDTCTEFGFFQTSTARPKLFSNTFPVDFFAQQCVDVFGPKFNMHTLEIAVPRRNILYGGLDLEVTNVVFVHGSVDPWHVLGLTHSSNPQAPAIFINGTAHCANMYPPSDRDMPQLKQARVQIKGLIEQWLNN
ncbi:hypothetical protein DMN91_009394 [Ooceraea biroi]|uniref:Serine protease K12H4.7 n=1 Tax=Ooceraea biroi TaxID=2015173 RepID=A0A3L8DFF6_OOCBI|nr:hypothetical protein DMN91_009394 [Ooceraea biroi]